jgi:LysM repeat protein
VHVVRSGDSLISIARRYSVTVKAIQELNGITNPDKIRIGQRIRIPAKR